jgi:uncharacterized protein (TIGR02757 family)
MKQTRSTTGIKAGSACRPAESSAPSASGLKSVLDRFYREYPFRERLLNDPIEFPHRYKGARDIEVSGFISSCFAYGRVDLFKAVIERILSRMGDSPCEFLLHFDPKRQRRLFEGIKYRFNENEDLICLLFLLGRVLRASGSLEAAFMMHYSEGDPDTGKGLTGFMKELLGRNTGPVYGANVRPPGLRQFFPSPAGGSTCKRANLFLRWMVRDRDIDFGIWKGIPKSKLVIPLDTHIARISRCLGLTKRKSQDWKTAVEITEALREFDSDDPLKYDFALCHHGISGMCRGHRERECDGCVFCGLSQKMSD